MTALAGKNAILVVEFAQLLRQRGMARLPQLRGLHIFVKLNSRNKLAAPQVLRLAKSEVPEWRSDASDRLRVVVGSFEGVSSPLVPAAVQGALEVPIQGSIAANRNLKRPFCCGGTISPSLAGSQ